MASFLEAQLDFIFFFYGLAFILLGAVCLSIARNPLGNAAGLMLFGLFGLVHGLVEWMELAAIVVGDTTFFSILRAVLLTASFLFLLEFARAGGKTLGLWLPGPWIHLPLLGMVAIAGFVGGIDAANALARYSFGFVGAIGSGLVLVVRSRQRAATASALTFAAGIGFMFYGIIAGLIGPAAPFWPASVINQTWFVELTGVPIQLVRGVLASALAIITWALWGKLLIEMVGSRRYSAHLRWQFVSTLAAMAAIFVCGWVLTDFLGGINRQDVEDEAKGDSALLVSRLTGETATLQALAKALAGSPSVAALLTGDAPRARQASQSVLDLNVEAAGAAIGIILDHSGQIVASSDRRELALLGMANESASPWFQSAIAGKPSYRVEFDRATGARVFVASHPIRLAERGIIGIVVLKKSLDALETALREFDRAFFLIDADGIVMLSNRSSELNRSLWPSSNVELQLAEQLGSPIAPALLASEVKTSGWRMIDGQRGYVLRTPVGTDGWSNVLVVPVSGMLASRLLGIIITLQFSITALFYFFGRDRGIRDSIQLERRMELQERAKDLQIKASTDALTGIANRLRFDEELPNEIARSRRHHTPFALVLFDVDNFKDVNDVHGHQSGDRVLVTLSAIVSHGVRQTDLLARWGGEEFAILLRETDALQSGKIAEQLRIAIAQAGFGDVGRITCSFGVACYLEGDTADSLVARADHALYRAKLNGRNRVELDSPMVAMIEVAPASFLQIVPAALPPV